MDEYPEHEKAKRLREDGTLDTLQEFYDWLRADGIHLARYDRPRERLRVCPHCKGSGVDSDALTPRQQQLMERGALAAEDWPACPECSGNKQIVEDYIDEDSLNPIRETPELLFARFCDIDYQAFMDEKDRMLEQLRAANHAAAET